MSAEPEAFMLDTQVFDRVLDGKVALAQAANRRLLVTGVQAAELRAIPDAYHSRRTDLLQTFEEIAPELCLAASFCLDIDGAGMDQALWNDGTGRFDQMLARLKSLDKKPASQHLNQTRDIIIAETAIKLSATLVSDDVALRQVVEEFGSRAVPSAHFAA